MTGSAVTVMHDGPMVVAAVRLPGCRPDHALTAFTDPSLLARWRGDDDGEREVRAGNREGWEHFLPRLVAIMSRNEAQRVLTAPPSSQPA